MNNDSIINARNNLFKLWCDENKVSASTSNEMDEAFANFMLKNREWKELHEEILSSLNVKELCDLLENDSKDEMKKIHKTYQNSNRYPYRIEIKKLFDNICKNIEQDKKIIVLLLKKIKNNKKRYILKENNLEYKKGIILNRISLEELEPLKEIYNTLKNNDNDLLNTTKSTFSTMLKEYSAGRFTNSIVKGRIVVESFLVAILEYYGYKPPENLKKIQNYVTEIKKINPDFFVGFAGEQILCSASNISNNHACHSPPDTKSGDHKQDKDVATLSLSIVLVSVNLLIVCCKKNKVIF